jgi:hypothetical protein
MTHSRKCSLLEQMAPGLCRRSASILRRVRSMLSGTPALSVAAGSNYLFDEVAHEEEAPTVRIAPLPPMVKLRRYQRSALARERRKLAAYHVENPPAPALQGIVNTRSYLIQRAREEIQIARTFRIPAAPYPAAQVQARLYAATIAATALTAQLKIVDYGQRHFSAWCDDRFVMARHPELFYANL